MRVLKTRTLWALAAACVLSAACSVGSAQPGAQTGAAAATTVYEGERIIVGDGTTTIENGAIVVQGNKITAVGTAGQVQGTGERHARRSQGQDGDAGDHRSAQPSRI